MNFLKKIFSPIILTISFLLLIYTFYKSEIYWNGDNRQYYYNYYLITLILIIFSTATFFINQKFKEYLIISFLALFVTLYFFEGYLGFNKQLSKKQILKKITIKDKKSDKSLEEQLSKIKLYEKKTGKKWDTRNIYQIYNDLKKNEDVVVRVGPSHFTNKNFSIYSLSGISNSETIFCNENGYYSKYRSDRYGFNNPDTEWDKKQIEYLLVGDSFTHGACVNRPNDISSVLRKISNKPVINLGQSGNGPLSEYATLREYLDRDVKNVLWIYYEGNDLLDLKNEINNNILVRYLNNLNFSQNLKFKQKEINEFAINNILESAGDAKKRELERRLKESEFKFKSFIKLYNTRILIFPPKPQLSSISTFKKILQFTKELLIKNDSELYFVYLPTYNRFHKNYNNNYNLVKNIVKELNIPFIDMYKEVFEKEDNPLKLFPFESFGHYTVEGYEKVALSIYNFTKN